MPTEKQRIPDRNSTPITRTTRNRTYKSKKNEDTSKFFELEFPSKKNKETEIKDHSPSRNLEFKGSDFFIYPMQSNGFAHIKEKPFQI